MSEQDGILLKSPSLKRCFGCKQLKAREQFRNNRSKKDGLASECKICARERARIDRAKRPKNVRKTSADPTVRKCSRCKEIKKNECFYRDTKRSGGVFYRSMCKLCWGEWHKEWNKAHPIKAREYADKWVNNNPEKRREVARMAMRKILSTPTGKINSRMRANLYSSLRTGKGGRKWSALVGYSVKELMKHLEKSFLPGMSWENINEWHVDHIIPISAFNYETTDDVDFKRCWSLNNLRPLWASDNLKKNNKLIRPFQPSLAISL
jgi:hypothetical protein